MFSSLYLQNTIFFLFKTLTMFFWTFHLEAGGKKGYSDLFPTAMEQPKKISIKHNFKKLALPHIKTCLHLLNREITHHQTISAQSGPISFQVVLGATKIKSVRVKKNPFSEARGLGECMKNKILAMKLPSQSKLQKQQNLTYMIVCDLIKTERSWTMDKVHRSCIIKS